MPQRKEFETIHLEKTKNICPMCEKYSVEQKSKPIVVICCEGSCLRGEVARQAANRICFDVAPDKTARICLGGAFTKDTGQRSLVRNALKVLALEGCSTECASRMMKGVIKDLNPEIVHVDRLYDFDENLFGINEVSENEIKKYAEKAAQKITQML